MRKRVYFYISIVIMFMLLFAAISCSPKLQRQEKRAKKKYFKALKLYPKLIDTTSKTDTVTFIDSVTVHTNHYITNTVLDSILEPCDPDTVIRWKIKRQIQEQCTIESILKGNAIIFRNLAGTHVLKAKGNDLTLVSEEKRIHTETTIYAPSERHEEEIKKLKKEHEKELKQTKINYALGFTVFGMLLLLAILILLRIIIKSGGLR